MNDVDLIHVDTISNIDYTVGQISENMYCLAYYNSAHYKYTCFMRCTFSHIFIRSILNAYDKQDDHTSIHVDKFYIPVTVFFLRFM